MACSLAVELRCLGRRGLVFGGTRQGVAHAGEQHDVDEVHDWASVDQLVQIRDRPFVDGFALDNFNAAERKEVPVICEQAADATDLLITQGLEPAQNIVHAWS